jgi:hypothetical protein
LVLWDSGAMYENELNLKEGEVVCIVETKDDEWWLGYVQSDPKKTFGYFPASFVQKRKDL